MLLGVLHRIMVHSGGMESTQEARVALNASLVLSKLATCATI